MRDRETERDTDRERETEREREQTRQFTEIEVQKWQAQENNKFGPFGCCCTDPFIYMGCFGHRYESSSITHLSHNTLTIFTAGSLTHTISAQGAQLGGLNDQ